MNQKQYYYYKLRIMGLMHNIEVLHNRYNTKATFEVAFPELTEEIWNAIDKSDVRKMMHLVEQLNKLSDTF